MTPKDRNVFYVIVHISKRTNTPTALVCMAPDMTGDPKLYPDHAMTMDERTATAQKLGLAENTEGYRAVFGQGIQSEIRKEESGLSGVYERRAKARRAVETLNKRGGADALGEFRLVQVGKLGREVKAIKEWRVEFNFTEEQIKNIPGTNDSWTHLGTFDLRRDARARRDEEVEFDKDNGITTWRYRIVPVYA